MPSQSLAVLHKKISQLQRSRYWHTVSVFDSPVPAQEILEQAKVWVTPLLFLLRDLAGLAVWRHEVRRPCGPALFWLRSDPKRDRVSTATRHRVLDASYFFRHKVCVNNTMGSANQRHGFADGGEMPHLLHTVTALNRWSVANRQLPCKRSERNSARLSLTSCSSCREGQGAPRI